jgi:hypothetical protein
MKLANILAFLVFLCFLTLTIPGQEGQFSSELSGYEFFRNPKLSQLTPLASAKADVIKAMGANCEHTCDYNEDWKISFSYVSSNWSIKSGDLLYKPKPEFVGKLWDISFRPRKQILLSEANKFPKDFRCDHGITTMGKLKYKSSSCMNDQRIVYSISDETVSDATVLVLNRQLMYVSYLPSKKAEDEIYMLVEK